MSRLNSRDFRILIASFLLCLALPVAFLWTAYVHSAYQRIGNMSRELTGVQLARKLVPHILQGENSELPQIQALAAKLDLFIDSAVPSSDPFVRTKYFGKVMEDVAVKSSLILDDDQNTYFLIAASFKNLPSSLRHFAGASETASAASAQNADPIASLISISGDLGIAVTKIREAIADLDLSCDCPQAVNGSAAYADLIKAMNRQEALYAQKYALTQTTATREDFFRAPQLQIGEGALQQASDQTIGILRLALEKVQASLNQRIRNAWRAILLISIPGFLLLALGLLGIRWQYKKNIVNLEALLSESEADRLQTEKMNSEVAGLNKTLAANLTALRQAQDEVVRKSRFEQMGQVTATIAHEIRNPLGAVRTSAFVIGRKVKPLNLGLDQQFDRINNGIMRCDRIISQLLDYSRTRKIDAEHHILDEQIAKSIAEEGERLPVQLRVHAELGCGETEVPFDIARLRRALANLMSNAAEAMVGAQTVDPTIWINTHIAKGYAVIAVRDNGPGISAENLPRIMEPLFTTKGFGTGLGLPAVQQIAEQHGGSLSVQSEPGKGATFAMTLALAPNLREAA